MKRTIIAAAFGSIVMLTASAPAHALGPVNPLSVAVQEHLADVVEIKGGKGWGRGHGWRRGHGWHRPPGWSRGRKVGWGGHGMPPGQMKKRWR